MIAKTERFELRLDAETLDRIDLWRSEQPDLPSRSETVRRLVEAGLGSPEGEQFFQIARFSILTAAKTKGPGDCLSNAYVYAWDASVYPLFDNGAALHLPFINNFRVTKSMVDELSSYLDDNWLGKSVPSFYQLEDHYKIRYGRTSWDRNALISVCKYLYLRDSFDEEFWKSLLKGVDHPSEAKSIVRKFDKEQVYLT